MLVLATLVYDVVDPDNTMQPAMAAELVVNLLKEEAPEIDSLETANIAPLKVWASAEPIAATRDAHMEYMNKKAQNDPDYGFTVTGKRIQNEALEEAQQQLIKTMQEEFNATEEPPNGP